MSIIPDLTHEEMNTLVAPGQLLTRVQLDKPYTRTDTDDVLCVMALTDDVNSIDVDSYHFVCAAYVLLLHAYEKLLAEHMTGGGSAL